MRDLYLKATSFTALKAHLSANSITMESNYFQNEGVIIDWIGKVPETFDLETGEVLSYFTQHRFNVRLLNDSLTLFDIFTNVFPETPYRTFS